MYDTASPVEVFKSRSTGKDFWIWVYTPVVIIYSTVALFILTTIDAAQPTPYLDEIYHIPQAQEYCRGNFTYWDDRITTLPGLYVISVLILSPVSHVTANNLCGIFHLRIVNILFSTFNLILYIWLTSKLHFSQESAMSWKGLLSAINIALFPPLYFFTFLYYTDMAAACMVLLMYAFYIKGFSKASAFVGALSIFVRQTNIVWTVMIGIGFLDDLLNRLLLTRKERSSNTVQSWRQIQMLSRKLLQKSRGGVAGVVRLIYQVVLRLLPFIAVALSFALFVAVNNGLVVGDRSAHQATIHVPQLFYYFAISATFSAPHWLVYIPPFVRSCTRRWLLSTMILATITAIIHCNTIVHPYLLADNRHYTFYVWKRLFEYRPENRYILGPLYAFGAYVVYCTMQRKHSFAFVTAFFICCSLSLVPQRLLEMRYFFIPFLLMRVHVPPRSRATLMLELIMYLAINAVTLYLFLKRPFYWPDSQAIQRFMW